MADGKFIRSTPQGSNRKKTPAPVLEQGRRQASKEPHHFVSDISPSGGRITKEDTGGGNGTDRMVELMRHERRRNGETEKP